MGYRLVYFLSLYSETEIQQIVGLDSLLVWFLYQEEMFKNFTNFFFAFWEVLLC